MSALEDFLAELKEAGDELAFEFSQDDWANALVDGWKKGVTMGYVLRAASGLKRPVSRDDLLRLLARAHTLSPSLPMSARLNCRTKVWIANNAATAGDALWEGDFDRAKRLFLLPRQTRFDPVAKMRRDFERDRKVTQFVRARDLDRKHDWNVCK